MREILQLTFASDDFQKRFWIAPRFAPVPIAAGERVYTRNGSRNLLDTGALDVVMLTWATAVSNWCRSRRWQRLTMHAFRHATTGLGAEVDAEGLQNYCVFDYKQEAA
ncbi:hypothetical protein AMC87_PD00927 (plasmid) [Rhizobium phaseoli]|nr:hypothetical protein AMC87_PD00927 [Rhizobium phaseoli]